MERVRLKIRTPKVNTIPAWGFGAKSVKIRRKQKLWIVNRAYYLRNRNE